MEIHQYISKYTHPLLFFSLSILSQLKMKPSFKKNYLYLAILACGILVPQTRDQIHTPCIRSVDSSALDHQGSPKDETILILSSSSSIIVSILPSPAGPLTSVSPVHLHVQHLSMCPTQLNCCNHLLKLLQIFSFG